MKIQSLINAYVKKARSLNRKNNPGGGNSNRPSGASANANVQPKP